MNCRDFQNEFEENARLTDAATLHLDSCTNCRKYHFEQTRLWEMLGALERREAPKDFDFQLKAKIARSKPEDYRQTGLFPALRYALPLSVVIVFLSIVALSGLYFVDRNQNASVAAGQTPNPAVNNSQPVNSFTAPDEIAEKNPPPPNEEAPAVDESTANRQPEAANNKPLVAENEEGGSRDLPTTRPNLIFPKEKDSGDGSGDRDIAGTNPRVITPPGIPDPNQGVKSRVNPSVAAQMRIKDLLEFVGIKIESLKVVSVGKDTIGERSGVKAGDTIEAINGKKITGDTLEGKQNSIKTLTVSRQGKRLEIVLRNK